MKEQLEAIRKKAIEAIGGAEAAGDLESLRVKYLGKKGELTAVLKQMGGLSARFEANGRPVRRAAAGDRTAGQRGPGQRGKGH